MSQEQNPETVTTPSTNKTSFFGSSFFSNVSSSVNALGQQLQQSKETLLPEMNKRLNGLQIKARQLPAQLTGDLESERTSFMQSNTNKESKKKTEFVAPWEGYKGYEKEMKREILELSKDERNFLISPPEETSFQFDLNAYSHSAQAALKQDEELSKMRFVLVPQQVREPIFWKNYFYRVTLVKQNVLSHPPRDEVTKNKDVLFDFKEEEEEDHKSIKSISSEDESIVEIIKQEEEKEEEAPTLEKKEEQNYEGMEDWEIELRKAAI